MGVDGENYNKKSTIDITNELTILIKEREVNRDQRKASLKSCSPRMKAKLKRTMTPFGLDKLEMESSTTNSSNKNSPFKKFQNAVSENNKKTALKKGDSFSMNDI